MSKPKRVDADLLIRQYYEEEKDTGQEGAYPEDTVASVRRVRDSAPPDATLSGGDIEASRSGTDTGEEAVGGSTPTPDQDVVDKVGKAVGIIYEDAEPLRFGDELADRDAQRWELNPASSEGYQERVQELTSSDPFTPNHQETTRPTQTANTGRNAPRRDKSRSKRALKKQRR